VLRGGRCCQQANRHPRGVESIICQYHNQIRTRNGLHNKLGKRPPKNRVDQPSEEHVGLSKPDVRGIGDYIQDFRRLGCYV
jgi:hypothetical protein